MKIYLVGGAVRDGLMGKPSKDNDWVVVDSSVQEMVDLGYKQVGADFPVFLHPETNEEYALARVERKTGYGYLGFTVDTSNVTLEEDLGRRDLTINSIAIDTETGDYIDPFGGISDIKDKILRHTSDAFSEDPLRVIRLARFAARYHDFSVCPSTQLLCREIISRGDLNHLPTERFWAELEKVIHEQHAYRFFDLLISWGVMNKVDFFASVFGDFRGFEHMRVLMDQIYKLPPDKRLLIFVGIFGIPAGVKECHGATSDMISLANIANTMNSNNIKDVDSLYNLLKVAGAFRNGDGFSNFTLLFSMFSSVPFDDVVADLSTVKADQFPLLQGKELGGAIVDARKRKLNRWINHL